MRNKIVFRWLLVAALLTAIVGCSTQSPVEPVNSVSTINPNDVEMSSPPANQIKFSAHVATIDLDERLLTFDEFTYVLVVPEDCPIVQIVDGDVISLELADLAVGDWVKVCSFLQEDGSVTANKIVLCTDDVCDGFDLAFQDSIATIDYAEGSFTVYGRTETILIDDNTLIWGMKSGFLSKSTLDDISTNSGISGESSYGHPVDTVFLFTDLQPGYILEIKADVINETTLLAVDIKVLSSNLKQSIEFQDYLASVDCENQTVTFETEVWIGSVCNRALLMNADGEALTLDGFAVGDNVAVKGVALTEETLRICEMILQ